MEVGMYIKSLRTKKGLTQEELGALIGVKKAAVQKWESGSVKNLKRNTIKRLAEIFEVSPVSFVSVQDSDSVDDLSSGESSTTNTKNSSQDNDLKFALFNGNEGITDEMFEEVKRFAELVRIREEQKNKEKK